MQPKPFDTRRLTILAMFGVLAFLLVSLVRIPIVLFLHYEPKDVVITIAGFLYGPFAAFMISCVVALVEMVTISADGFIGLIMNIITSCAFACTAAFIYQRRRTLVGAVVGLLAGVAAMTIAALLWNYLVTPIYMGVPRQAVAAMLLPYFLPFNLLKSGLNAAITMLVYKPASRALRLARLMPEPSAAAPARKAQWGVVLAAAFVLISLIAVATVWARNQAAPKSAEPAAPAVVDTLEGEPTQDASEEEALGDADTDV